MHAHRHFLPGCPSDIHIRLCGYYTHNCGRKEQCATLAHAIHTEILSCPNSLPISVFCFKKSICSPAITPRPALAFVALRRLFRTASPLRHSPRVCSLVGLNRCSATFPQAIGTLVSVALVLCQAGKRPLPRVSNKP